MHNLFSQLSVLGSSLALMFSLSLLWRRRVHAYISAFAWQSAVLAGVAALAAFFAGDWPLYVVAALIFLLKVIAMPLLLRRMQRRFDSEAEMRPYVNTATSGLIAAALVIGAYNVTRPLVAASSLPTRDGIPLAMALVFVSLFFVVTRKKAISQIVGFLMLENGIALLAVLAAYGVPLVVELGVFLDALMGFLVMQVFVYQIHETFESIDVEQLNALKH